jgi:hypothetical protein
LTSIVADTSTALLLLLRLLEQDCLKFDVAIVENESLSHKLFQEVPVNGLKLRVFFEAFHELLDILFVVHPVLLVLLDLVLGIT